MDEAERQVREQLAQLQREYQERARHLVETLVWLEMMKPPPPIFITREQAQALNFPVEAVRSRLGVMPQAPTQAQNDGQGHTSELRREDSSEKE